MLVVRYESDVYPFRRLVQQHFGQPLSTLHRNPMMRQTGETDQSSGAHAHAYKIGDPFWSIYDAFTRHLIDRWFRPGDWLMQTCPTFRFQFPGGRGTKEFHRDRDYRHPIQTVNVLVPLTRMVGTARVELEVAPCVETFDAPTLRPGQALMFDGANTRHGTARNTEGYTRVSFDFRLLQRCHLPPPGTVTMTAQIPMAVGHYYREVPP